MSDFILRHVVRDVLRSTNEADPGVIAGMVMARIDKADREAALTQAMRLFVRQVISETRTGNRPTGKSAVTPIHNRSRKVAAIRDGWQRRLRDRVHVGESTWKQLGDCTYDDLMAAASERQEQADRNRVWAREYRAMALAIREGGVERFADLPAETQMKILGGAA